MSDHFVTQRPNAPYVPPSRSSLPELPPFTGEILALLRDADAMEELLWSRSATGWDFALKCSDTFAWGCADAESITGENIATLRDVVFECKTMEDGASDADDLDTRVATCYVGELFAARVRGVRPMRAWYRKVLKTEPGSAEHVNTGVAALFDAAGPWHDPEFRRP